ncbi:LamG domain-containing protein [Actinomadura sp. 6N118]|uniref:LamG domain-containing protein n=1 Tax=Actinomadura sp. 6N118 TaxID=3375151 RepID=UPI0037A5A536
MAPSRARRGLLAGLLPVVLTIPLLGAPAIAGRDQAIAEPASATDGIALSPQDAAQEAQRAKKPVQVLSLADERRNVVASADGTFTATLSGVPFQTRKGNKFVPVDTRLRKMADGRWEPSASTVGVIVSGGGKGAFVRVSRAGREFSLTLPGELPAPTVAGDTATYVNAVSEGIDLAVRVLPDGISHFLVVRTPDAARNPKLADVRLAVGGSKIKLRSAKDGGVRVEDRGSGNELFEADAPTMWDSAGQPTPAAARSTTGGQNDLLAGPNDGARVSPVKATVADGTLSLKPDLKLLSSVATEFPVVIDPVFKTVNPSSSGYGYAMVSDRGGLDASWDTEGVGYCHSSGVNMASCGSGLRKRIFYRFPTKIFKGQNVITAALQVKQTLNYDGDMTAVQTWATKNYSASTTWGGQDSFGDGKFWDRMLQEKSTNYGSPAANANTVRFDSAAVTDYVHRSSLAGSSQVVFGLKAKSESTFQNWKRFDNYAYLQVQFNLPPHQPRQAHLTTDGGPCQPIDAPLIVNKVPMLRAGLTDPNDTEKLQGELELEYIDPNLGFSSPAGGWKTNVAWENENFDNPTRFEFNMAQAEPAANKQIRWRIAAHDFRRDSGGNVTNTWQGMSPWSDVPNPDTPREEHWCNFVIDTNAPAKPQVTSLDGVYSEYPTNTLWNGGAGVPGRFKLAAAPGTPAWDIPKSYVVTFTDWAAPRTIAAAADGSVELPLSPTSGGEKVLVVTAKDGANRLSASYYYVFRVKEEPPAAAYWRLDDAAGARQLVNDQDANAFSAAVQGADVSTGAVGKRGTALRLNRDADPGTVGYAQTDKPLINPVKSYSVSAWAKLENNGAFATVLGQDGAVITPFYLQYSQVDNRWKFAITGGDYQGNSVARALSNDAPTLGRWTHLVGVYDASAKNVSLYVDGKLQQTQTAPETQWSTGGAGPFTIGRTKYNGGSVDFFPGEIDEVKVLTRAVSASEAEDLYYGTVSARWRLDSAGGTVPDDTGGHGLTLQGGAAIATSVSCTTRVVGPGCLSLPQGGYGETSGPVLETDRSFTIAGWATPAGVPGANAAVFSQAGNVNSGFTVRYAPTAYNGLGGWQIEVPDKDTSDADMKTVDHDKCSVCEGSASTPDHLALVYDAPTRTMKLYVNGLLGGAVESVREGVSSFNADGKLQIGRALRNGTFGQPFAGLVDDVWVYQGALLEDQIGQLHSGVEFRLEDAP